MECFHQPLPQLLRGHLEYKSVAPSSTTTANAVPPYALLCKSHSLFLKYAEDYLKEDRVKESEYSSQQIGPEFEQLTLDNEADLVLASHLFVIKPFLNILNIRYGKNFTASCEQTAKKDLLGESGNSARMDFVFRSAKDNQIVFVLEFKRRELIRYDDYRGALLPEDAKDIEIQAKIQEAEAALVEDGDDDILLGDNAMSHTKQLAMYASQNDCEHVALLNWDHLLLFEFNKRSEAEATETTAGETAGLTWVSEHRELECEHVNQGNIRKALLGFALHAFEKHDISTVS
jgi:hypothetical protein